MGRLLDSIYILFNGTEKFMAKDKKMETTFVKNTEKYSHEDVPGVNPDDLDMDSFKTVDFPSTGAKLVVGRTKKDNKLVAVRFLVPKKKK